MLDNLHKSDPGDASRTNTLQGVVIMLVGDGTVDTAWHDDFMPLMPNLEP